MINNKDIWYPIPEYDQYLINKNGEIYSLYRNEIKKGSIDAKGYPTSRLTNHNGTITKKIHRLVAEIFIPNPDNKPQVNHINGIKIDNCIGNLEWVTNRENRDHALENNLVDERSKPKPIYVINLKTNHTQIVNSSYDAMKLLYPDLKVSNPYYSKKTKIKEILVGKRKSQNGYTFRYVDDNP